MGDSNKGSAPPASQDRDASPSGLSPASGSSQSGIAGAGVLPGDIVQITDKSHHWFPCLIVVSELKSFGIQGFAFMPTNDGSGTGEAYIRLTAGSYEPVGGSVIITTLSLAADREAAAKARGDQS